MDQRVKQVDRKAHRNRSTKDDFEHERLLKSFTGGGVKPEQAKQPQPERDKDDVGHEALPLPRWS